MAKLTLRCVQHYLLGDRKIAPGDLITFSTPEEQKWFLNNLLWSAFIPEFIDEAADTSPTNSDTVPPAQAATGFPDLAHALAATPTADLTNIPGIGATTAAKLQTWAQNQITPPPADTTPADAPPTDPPATP